MILNIINIENIKNTHFVDGFHGDFRWLSNMVKIEPFQYGNLVFDTVENFYQAMKTKEKSFQK